MLVRIYGLVMFSMLDCVYLLLNETIVSEIDQDMFSQLKALDIIHRHHQQQSLRIVGLNQVLQSYLSVTVVYEEKMTLVTIDRDSNIFLNRVLYK